MENNSLRRIMRINNLIFIRERGEYILSRKRNVRDDGLSHYRYLSSSLFYE